MKKQKAFLLIFLLILLVPFVLGVGTCELDKSWNYGQFYNPLETAFFSCSCTSPIEEGQAGYAVWMNSSGSILQSASIDSGSCRTSIFFSSYTFPISLDVIGNVTFSLNADGTGIPTNWDDANDNTTDRWNVTGSDALSCIISNIKNKGVIGSYGALEFKVSDGITGYPILHSDCSLRMGDIDDNPFSHYVEGGLIHHVQTDADGFALFHSDFSKRFWTVDTTYKFHVSCHCLQNDTSIDGELLCYNPTEGGVFDEKYCSAVSQITTSSDDFRKEETFGIPLMILFSLMIVLFLILFISFNTSFRFVFLLMVFVSLNIMTRLMHQAAVLNNLDSSLTNPLYITYYVSLIFTLFMFFYVFLIFFSAFKTSNFKEDNFNDGYKKGFE